MQALHVVRVGIFLESINMQIAPRLVYRVAQIAVAPEAS